jgi:hypothetical protein
MASVLALHNSLRAKHGVAPLTWSDSIAAGAQSWANGCVMQHSNSGYGENLAMGYNSPAEAVQVRPCMRGPIRGPMRGPMPGPMRVARRPCQALPMHGTTASPHAHLPACPPNPTQPHTPRHKAWYDELASYSYGNGGFSEATGHATQLLWKGSTQLGCGYAPGCKLLVCRYNPPGNVMGQFDDNVSPPTA